MRYLIAAALCAAFSCPAFATPQMQCAPREKVLETLQKKYGEQPIIRAIDSNDYLVEITSNEDRSSWSLLIEPPNEHPMACLLAAGKDWSEIPEADLHWKPAGQAL